MARTLTYKLQKVGCKTILNVYANYPDCGPYCLSWDRVLVKDIPRVRRELADKGITEAAQSH